MNTRLTKLLVILAWLDIITTHIVLANGGIEINPFMVNMIDTWLGLTLKLMLTASVAVYLYYRNSKLGLIITNSMMILIVLWNVSMIIYIKSV